MKSWSQLKELILFQYTVNKISKSRFLKNRNSEKICPDIEKVHKKKSTLMYPTNESI